MAMVASVLLGIPGSAQSPADLLQRGIYAQETAGDLDSAIQIFRQVASSSTTNKGVAAQAQYQLVLCMLQRGDRAGAGKEVETLARNFPDQQDMVIKARKLMPGASALLPVPWGESEGLQLNIKRDGAVTGESIYYSVDPPYPLPLQERPTVDQQALRWELTTKKSVRTVLLNVDRNTGQEVGRPVLTSDDEAGDPAAESIAGPAIDVQDSVFAMRRLPLAVGYKTKFSSLPFVIGHSIPKDLELAVTGIEPVEVTAGKFKCYKVSLSPIGQTFWFAVEGARPLVKFKAGNTEGELMKTWGPENFIESELKFFRSVGWKIDNVRIGPGPKGTANTHEDTPTWRNERPIAAELGISAKKVYTSAAEIPQALRAGLPSSQDRFCKPETIQTRQIAGIQAVSCIVRKPEEEKIGPVASYYIWLRTEGAAIELSGSPTNATGVFRWQIDRVLDAAKRTP